MSLLLQWTLATYIRQVEMVIYLFDWAEKQGESLPKKRETQCTFERVLGETDDG